ncbi:MAG: hypothetical protein ACTSWX_07635 [Promethearchaeota archaeon]
MKIEIMNINFMLKKLQHITSKEIIDIRMKNSKIESLPAILAYIEDYSEKNGFEILNGVSAGNNIQLYLIKN